MKLNKKQTLALIMIPMISIITAIAVNLGMSNFQRVRRT